MAVILSVTTAPANKSGSDWVTKEKSNSMSNSRVLCRTDYWPNHLVITA